MYKGTSKRVKCPRCNSTAFINGDEEKMYLNCQNCGNGERRVLFPKGFLLWEAFQKTPLLEQKKILELLNIEDTETYL